MIAAMARAVDRILPVGVGWLVGACCWGGCRAVVDPGLSFQCDLNGYQEEFAIDDAALAERCWREQSADPADVVVDDDDLVVRVSEGERWADGSQGPAAFQRLERDFVAVTRVEILSSDDGDHCLEVGNRAGWVVRDDGGDWSTFLLGIAPPSNAPGCDNEDEAPPAFGYVESGGPGGDAVWGEPAEAQGEPDQGIGKDGEADLAVCRLNGKLLFYYREMGSSVSAPVWRRLGGQGFEHFAGEGAVDVGLTASGSEASFQAEGHFQWVYFHDSVGTDGCVRELEAITLPEVQ